MYIPTGCAEEQIPALCGGKRLKPTIPNLLVNPLLVPYVEGENFLTAIGCGIVVPCGESAIVCEATACNTTVAPCNTEAIICEATICNAVIACEEE